MKWPTVCKGRKGSFRKRSPCSQRQHLNLKSSSWVQAPSPLVRSELKLTTRFAAEKSVEKRKWASVFHKPRNRATLIHFAYSDNKVPVPFYSILFLHPIDTLWIYKWRCVWSECAGGGRKHTKHINCVVLEFVHRPWDAHVPSVRPQ